MKSNKEKKLNLSFGNNENIDPDFEWTFSNNRSTSVYNNSAKASSKNKLQIGKGQTSKLTKTPLYSSKDNNIVPINQWFSEAKVRSDTHKQSTIEFLKKEFSFLEQDEIDNYQFPSEDIHSHHFHRLSQQKINQKTIMHQCSRINVFLTASNDSRGFIMAPMKQRPLFHRKIKRNYLKNKQRSSKPNDENEIVSKMGKTFNKFQIIAPYRKYFQSNRFHKNKTCTMKIDQILGHRISKLNKPAPFQNPL